MVNPPVQYFNCFFYRQNKIIFIILFSILRTKIIELNVKYNFEICLTLKRIASPIYEWKSLKNFPLGKLEQTFFTAEFERPLRLRHISKIVEAMIANEFFNNILSVIQKRNGKFEIIDGQHRIEALKELRDNYGVTHYNLVLMIFPEKYARKIYRRINLGQPLKMQDHLRALDNGSHPFFTQLRTYFVHYNDGILPKFSMILSALSYAKNGSPRAVRPLLLDRMFKNITINDLKFIKSFSVAIANVEPHIAKRHQILYSHPVYRNTFRVGYENKFNEKTWENFITICKTDKKIDALHKIRTMAAIREIYGHMIEKICGEMGLQLKRIDRTVSEARQVLNKNTDPVQSASPIFFQT